jgi:geranylgeranyl diphosphate synthase type II
MLILAYQYFEQYEPVFMQIVNSKTTLEVCEGQWDVDFETHVFPIQTLKMIL